MYIVVSTYMGPRSNFMFLTPALRLGSPGANFEVKVFKKKGKPSSAEEPRG